METLHSFKRHTTCQMGNAGCDHRSFRHHGNRGGSYALRNFDISFTLNSSVFAVFMFVICAPLFLFASVGGQGRDSAMALFSVLMIRLTVMSCVIVIVGMILQLIVILAYRASVLENLGVIASIRRALYLMRARLGSVLLIGFLLLLLRIAFFVTAYVIQFVVSFATTLLMAGSGNNSTAGTLVAVATGCFLLLFLLVLVCADSLLNTFNSATWTLAYREWHTQELPS